MWLKHIQVSNFRNLSAVKLDLTPGLNVFSGENGAGKTNFLEAVYCLLKGRSFRTNYERECQTLLTSDITEEKVTIVKGLLIKQQVEHSLRYVLAGESKRLYVDDKVVERLADYWTQVAVVLFSWEDLNVVKGAPATRRKFLDILASQLFPSYIKSLQNFHVLLKQRNNLLRSIVNKEASQTELDLWDERLTASASELFTLRWQVVEQLNRQVGLIFTRLSGKNESVRLTYENFLSARDLVSKEEAQSRYQDLLVANLDIDLERGLTTTGPQRDDVLIEINGLDTRNFASHGEQRTVMISLRLAESQLLREYFNESPIILLDDVLSELDERHQMFLLKELPSDTQTFLTTVNTAQAVFDNLNGTFFTVADGGVKKL